MGRELRMGETMSYDDPCDDAIEELTEAIRLTQEYIQLPAEEGWSWYDALKKYAPEKADYLRAQWDHPTNVTRLWAAPVDDSVDGPEDIKFYQSYQASDTAEKTCQSAECGCNKYTPGE